LETNIMGVAFSQLALKMSKHNKVFKTYGIITKDVHNKQLPMINILAQMSDKYKKLGWPRLNERSFGFYSVTYNDTSRHF